MKFDTGDAKWVSVEDEIKICDVKKEFKIGDSVEVDWRSYGNQTKIVKI